MTDAQRAAWERRWAQEPGLRPPCRFVSGPYRSWQAWDTMEPGEAGGSWSTIAEVVAEALILARAVEWLTSGGCRVFFDTTPGYNVTVSLGMIDATRGGSDWCDALGSAVDAVLAART